MQATISSLTQAIKIAENPAQKSLEASRDKVIFAWHKVAENLDKSGDHGLANEVRGFVASADKPIISRNQQLYDELTKVQSKEHAVDRGEHEL